MTDKAIRTEEPPAKFGGILRDPITLVSAILSLAAIVWFFWVEQRFGGKRSQSVFTWLESAWNDENDYEHGILFPFVILGLIMYQFKELRYSSGLFSTRFPTGHSSRG